MEREWRTVRAMVALFCRDRHLEDGFCPGCAELLDYARDRLQKCPFRECKPACANCRIHCYRKSMRASMREVMRFAGPRMLWRRPLLALLHMRDARFGPRPAAPARRPAARGQLRT